jgi:cytochrome c oxidase subunit 4
MTEHIVPQRIYYLVFATLLLLTLVTVDVAFYDLGLLTFHIAMAIATTKALVVIFYFMHVRYSPPLTWVFAGAGFFWLVILLGLTLSDVMTRGWLPVPPPWSPAALQQQQRRE